MRFDPKRRFRNLAMIGGGTVVADLLIPAASPAEYVLQHRAGVRLRLIGFFMTGLASEFLKPCCLKPASESPSSVSLRVSAVHSPFLVLP